MPYKIYIVVWESGCLENDTYHEEMKDYVTHWKDVAKKLDYSFSLDASQATTRVFLPPTTYTTTNASIFDAIQEDMIPKDDSEDSFCGITCNRQEKSHNPLHKCFF